ncbi:hypothetical protein [Chryseobacterium sp. Hurlbut01]|uniref:hypothetical protein n=1 Tax=Chryseobacterium sp. Hurlbut01 TaxID=1681828 RepID=UPI001364A724|nr:hypothetical protein [Chryseobacterium sp. Hurlbut01]
MEYYRNKIDVISYEGVHVDAESLWQKKGDLMVLADEDQYITFPFDENKFYKVRI